MDEVQEQNLSQTEDTGIDPPATDTLAGLTHDEYQEWNRTGKLPEPAAEPSEKEIDAHGEPSPPEKGPREAIESRKESTKKRFAELLDDRRADRARIAELERQLASKSEEKPATPAAPKTIEQAKGAYRPSDKAKKEIDRINADFNAGKYSSYEEYSDDKAAVMVEDRIEQREAEQKAQRAEEEKASRERTAKEEFDKVLKNWGASVEVAKTVHPDFEDVAGPLMGTSEIPAGSLVEGWILDSPIGTEILYHFGSHRDELKSVLGKPALAQARELTKLEIKLEKSVSKDEKPSQAAPPKQQKASRAPEPAKELGSGGGATRDAVEQAFAAKDVAAYIREANSRDIQRLSRRG